MIVEFETIKSSSFENYERELQAELSGPNSVPYCRSKDYITTIALEMDTVIDYEAGLVYHNAKLLNCIYVRVADDISTRNILITSEEFKSILEHTRNCKIKTAEEILKQIRNENNSASI